MGKSSTESLSKTNIHRGNEQMKCDECHNELSDIDRTEFGDPMDHPSTPWEQRLCDECYNRIWDEIMAGACPVCRTHPCERGRSCWVNPFPRLMYLCYVAPRKQSTTESFISVVGVVGVGDSNGQKHLCDYQ